MVLKTHRLGNAIYFALAVSATAVLGTGVASAQKVEPAADKPEATTLDPIQVTG